LNDMNSDTRKIIIKLYEDGFGVAGIAASLSLPEPEVQRFVDRLGALLHAPKLKKTTKAQVFELIASGSNTDEIAKTLNVREDSVIQIIDKDKSKIVDDARGAECLELYKNGASLEEIGNKFGVTRERVRQITRKQFAVDLGYGPLEREARKAEIAKLHRMLVKSSRSERKSEITERRYEEALAKGLEPQYFDSLKKYCDATGTTPEALKAHVPQAYHIIERNAWQKARKWSWYFDACRTCGTTTTKHKGYGYCEKCYILSPEFKSIQQRSHQKNRDANLARNRAYLEDYYNRPEIIERIEREYDEKYFGGNRKAALERDGYCCKGCKMSVDIKDKMGRPRVRVWHLRGKDNHDLVALGTYCQSCLFKAQGMTRWNNNFRKST